MAETITIYQAESLFDLPDPYTQADVKKAYRRLIVEKHPDVRKDVDEATANREASELNAANKLLMNRFKGNPSASYSRARIDAPKRTATPAGGYRPQPAPSGSGYQAPTAGWYEWYWQTASPETEEAPVEEVTWEDLANEFWSEYTDQTAEMRIEQGRTYSMDDMKRDSIRSVFEKASKGAARAADAFMSNAPSKQQAEVDAAVLAYRRHKHSIDWWTGRMAVLGYSVVLGFVIFVAVMIVNATTVREPMIGVYGMGIGTLLFFIALINVIYPFLTVLLRKVPYRRLDREYMNLPRNEDGPA